MDIFFDAVPKRKLTLHEHHTNKTNTNTTPRPTHNTSTQHPPPTKPTPTGHQNVLPRPRCTRRRRQRPSKCCRVRLVMGHRRGLVFSDPRGHARRLPGGGYGRRLCCSRRRRHQHSLGPRHSLCGGLALSHACTRCSHACTRCSHACHAVAAPGAPAPPHSPLDPFARRGCAGPRSGHAAVASRRAGRALAARRELRAQSVAHPEALGV